jgi:predicted AAA+ superfamily ATPase
MYRKTEEKLLGWKNTSPEQGRKPLLLFGARQVGKTYLLDKFGRNHFANTVYVNLETNVEAAQYFSGDITPERLIRFLESMARETIRPGQTLIILDEVQSCERALTSLKYFCEQAPQYHIAAAGSLLGVAVNREHYSFPVGKVESLTLYPLDFEEFLLALDEARLAADIRQAYAEVSPLPAALHARALEFYRYYLIVGGMPACVTAFARDGKLVLAPTLQNEIVNNYVADMAKYADKTAAVKIRACFNSLPAQLAKENHKFQYKVVQQGGSAAFFGAALEWLIQSGVALKCQKITQASNPLAAYADLPAFKIYLSDTGLLTLKAGLPQQTILSGVSNNFLGAVTENYIAQALAANGHTLFYWASAHLAELDFVLQHGEQITGIEVKKGLSTRSKSLNQFLQKYPSASAIRFSEKNFGNSNNILALPHYAAFCV